MLSDFADFIAGENLISSSGNSSRIISVTNSPGVIKESRELFDYRDIDNTLTTFLQYFQQKYLYGIPYNIISNKRFLLKHILDVYRSKGSIQCYRLLFKLIYNEDVKVYLPGTDVLKPSDGTWKVPRCD